MPILALPIVFLLFMVADLWNGWRWKKHNMSCPCPYGPGACDRGNRG
jgi:hypothetical protein